MEKNYSSDIEAITDGYSPNIENTKKKYSLKQKAAKAATIGGLALIALTAPGCATLTSFAKSQAEPYVVYNKEGVIDEKTGEIKFALPYWQTKPVASTLKVAAHAAIITGIVYGIKKYCDSQQTPTPEPEPVDEDPDPWGDL